MFDWILRRLFPRNLPPTEQEVSAKEKQAQQVKERAKRARETSELIRMQVEAETDAIRGRRHA